MAALYSRMSEVTSRCSQFPGRNHILETVRVETIETHARRLRLGINQETEPRAIRSGQGHIMSKVVGQPVCLPRSEQRVARRHDLGIPDAEIAGQLLKSNLAHVSRIDRHPTEAREIDFRAAVLCV